VVKLFLLGQKMENEKTRILSEFNIGKKYLVCVDLSTDNLKIAVATIAMLGNIKVSNLINRNLQGLSDENISEIIKESLNKINVKNPIIISVIPSHLSITKNIEIPSIIPEEIEGIINLQASRHTPYSREDIIISYIKIGIYKSSHTKALFVVVSRDKIRKQFDILEAAGLKIEKVLFGPEMISRICSKILKLETLSHPRGIIHIDKASTDFIIALRNTSIFVRNIPIGNQHLADKPEEYRTKFVEEIKNSFDVYRAEGVEENPQEFIFIGAGNNIKDLKATLDETLDIPSQIVTYSDSLAISDSALEASRADKDLSFLNNLASLFTYQDASVNLIPEEIKSKRSFEKKTKDIVKIGALGISIFFLIIGILFSKIYFKNAILKKLTLKYKPIVQEAKILEENFKRIITAKKYLSNEGYSLEILMEIYNFVSDDIRLDEIRFDQTGFEAGSLTIKGVAQKDTDGDKDIPATSVALSFTDNIKKSKYFQNVEIDRRKREGKKELVDFTVKCRLRKEKGE
jgi:Tfp pilus assembly PilM family ATPase